MAAGQGGFCFDLCKRNEFFEARGVKHPGFTKTGTTIAGIIFKVRPGSDGPQIAALGGGRWRQCAAAMRSGGPLPPETLQVCRACCKTAAAAEAAGSARTAHRVDQDSSVHLLLLLSSLTQRSDKPDLSPALPCRCRVCMQDGVVLGADTRSTAGTTVADKNCEKIHYIGAPPALSAECCCVASAAPPPLLCSRPLLCFAAALCTAAAGSPPCIAALCTAALCTAVGRPPPTAPLPCATSCLNLQPPTSTAAVRARRQTQRM